MHNEENIKQQLKGQLKNYVESITEKSKGKNQYVCPLCSSGTGENGTGAFSIKEDNDSWKCFACNNGGDIFDLVGQTRGLTGYKEQLDYLKEVYNYSLEANNDIEKPIPVKEVEIEEQAKDYADYTSLFLMANKNIEKTDYHRGISLETLNKFKIGYLENWTPPQLRGKIQGTPRLIIPTGKGSYLARDTRKEVPKEQKQYTKQKVGRSNLFNQEALSNKDKPIYIVEGEIDALSVIDVGGEAVGLGSIGNIRLLENAIKNTEIHQPLIIAMDNDKAGQEASNKLQEALSSLQVEHYTYDVCNGHKDTNEALNKDRQAFKNRVMQGNKIKEEQEKKIREEYLKTSTAGYLQDFIDGVSASANTPVTPTGFNSLDYALDGGLYEGLYVVGAISSLGKTTLITQIADQVAQDGNDVIIFSLEMARSEIMAKSISRLTKQILERDGGNPQHAKTVRGITDGARYKDYCNEELNLIKQATKEYSKYAGNIFIQEGLGNLGADDVKQAVDKHISITGKTPLVVIDYLQILAPHNERASDKQNTDKAVMELKRISRDYKLPLIAISSFNRASYKSAVSMASFKESGAVEYSSDVLIGLQLKGANEDNFNVDEAKSKNPREIELIILKNRNGKTGVKVDFNYLPMFNDFTESK